MKKRTPSSSFLFRLFGKIFKKIQLISQNFTYLFQDLDRIGKKKKKTFEKIQLTFIYFFALATLIITINLYLGFFPELYANFIPFSKEILASPLALYIASPGKTFILYLLINELIIIRSFFNFSVIIRFHILYIIILEMIMNALINWWDFLCNKEIDEYTYKFIDRVIAQEFFSGIFLIFFSIYFYSYIQAMRNKLPKLPHPVLQKIPDSAAFWLQLQRTENSENDQKNI